MSRPELWLQSLSVQLSTSGSGLSALSTALLSGGVHLPEALARRLSCAAVDLDKPVGPLVFRRSGCTCERCLTSAQVFELNMWRAWGAVATTVASVALSVYLIAISPWYLLPLAWAFAGTAWTGVRLRLGTVCALAAANTFVSCVQSHRLQWCEADLKLEGVVLRHSNLTSWPERGWVWAAQLFVIGHDCGHRSFSKNKLLEDIVGTLAFMPLIYPFEPWRIKHNHHHAHTNKCAQEFCM